MNAATVFSPIQERAVRLLLSGSTISAAARELGIDRTTIYTWRKNHPFFTIALQQARKSHTESLADTLQDLASTALDTIREILTSKDAPPAVRLRAAQTILGSLQQQQQQPAPPQPEEPPQIQQNPTEFDTVSVVEPAAIQAQQQQQQTTLPLRLQSTKVGRNEPCPCGSNLKYKRCCGNTVSPIQIGATK